MDDVVKVNAYLADLARLRRATTQVYDEFFDEPYPARTSVQAGLPAGVLVEIEAVARRLMSERDLVGYGASPPDPQWPGGARLALSFVLNYEEGGERTPLEGDPAVGVVPARGRRRAADGRPAEPEHRVDVRVREPRRASGACTGSSRSTACR